MLTSRFEDALVYATQLHASQIRKGTTIPYVAHLLGVASIALEYGADEDTAIAALLHDAVEDQGGPPIRAEIARRYGEHVAKLVSDVSDTDVTPKPPWRARKEAYIAHVSAAEPGANLISASDKLHNARTLLSDYRVLGEGLWSRFSAGREDVLWYYRSLVTAFRATGHAPKPLVDELDRTVEALAGLCLAAT